MVDKQALLMRLHTMNNKLANEGNNSLFGLEYGEVIVVCARSSGKSIYDDMENGNELA